MVDADCEDGLCMDGTCLDAAPLTCPTPGTLVCGASVTGNTTGAVNTFSEYPSCLAWANATGGEHIYALMFAEETEVTVDLTEIAVDLELFVLAGGCDSGLCIAVSTTTGNEQVSFPAFPGTPYFIVVDGFAGAEGSYRLSTTCDDGGEPPTDFCEAMGSQECCDGTTVRWCEGNERFERDCALWGHPGVDDFCGWDAWMGAFWCGGTDPVPDGIDPVCPAP